MISALLGLALGLPAMWLFSRLANLAALSALKSEKYALMKQAFTHTGSFSELLIMQKKIIALSFMHLRIVAWPALLACIPIILFLFLRPEMATMQFFLGVVCTYIFAKWRWKI